MSSTARKAGLGGRGGHPLLTGVLIGLVAGVGLSAGVAVWVSRMPSPFQNRSLDSGGPVQAAGGLLGQTAAPNAAGGQSAATLGGSSGTGSASTGAAPSGDAGSTPPASEAALSARLSTRLDPAHIGAPANGASAPGEAPQGADARRDQPSAASSAASAARIPDGTLVFLQVGAYSAAEDAQKQVETVAQLTGARARISPGEGDKPLFRVRVGPFNQSADYAELVDALRANGISSTVVRSGAAEAQH